MNDTQSKNDNASTVAGIAGAGIGTTITAIAQCLPDTSSFKRVLIIAAPTIAVIINAFVKYLLYKFNIREITKRIDNAYLNLRWFYQSQLDDPDITLERRMELAKQINYLNDLRSDADLRMIKDLVIIREDKLGYQDKPEDLKKTPKIL